MAEQTRPLEYAAEALSNMALIMNNVRAPHNPRPVVLFVHGLRTPAGESRIVVAGSQSVDTNLFNNAGELDVRVYRPGSLMKLPTQVGPIRGSQYSGLLALADLGTGASDPSDPTHFTIPYSFKGQTGTVDGWLRNDDSVRLVVRDGPGTQPAR